MLRDVRPSEGVEKEGAGHAGYPQCSSRGLGHRCGVGVHAYRLRCYRVRSVSGLVASARHGCFVRGAVACACWCDHCLPLFSNVAPRTTWVHWASECEYLRCCCYRGGGGVGIVVSAGAIDLLHVAAGCPRTAFRWSARSGEPLDRLDLRCCCRETFQRAALSYRMIATRVSATDPDDSAPNHPALCGGVRRCPPRSWLWPVPLPQPGQTLAPLPTTGTRSQSSGG